MGLSAEPRGGWVSLLGPWPRSQKGQRDKVLASWHQVTAPTQGPGFQASLPGRESCRSAGSRQSQRPILEAAMRTKRLWHRPLTEGAEREPHRPVRLQPCRADQAADREPDSRSPGETAPGPGKGRRGRHGAPAGGPDRGCGLAPAPEAFSIPQFHHPGLGGSIRSLVSQMKDAF